MTSLLNEGVDEFEGVGGGVSVAVAVPVKLFDENPLWVSERLLLRVRKFVTLVVTDSLLFDFV